METSLAPPLAHTPAINCRWLLLAGTGCCRVIEERRFARCRAALSPHAIDLTLSGHDDSQDSHDPAQPARARYHDYGRKRDGALVVPPTRFARRAECVLVEVRSLLSARTTVALIEIGTDAAHCAQQLIGVSACRPMLQDPA